jgi:hypothetical protein
VKLFIARNTKKMGGTIQQCTKIAPSAVPWDFHRIRLKQSKEKTALDVHTRNKINKSKIQTDKLRTRKLGGCALPRGGIRYAKRSSEKRNRRTKNKTEEICVTLKKATGATPNSGFFWRCWISGASHLAALPLCEFC